MRSVVARSRSTSSLWLVWVVGLLRIIRCILLVVGHALLGNSVIVWLDLRLVNQNGVGLDSLGMTAALAMSVNYNSIGDDTNEEEKTDGMLG